MNTRCNVGTGKYSEYSKDNKDNKVNLQPWKNTQLNLRGFVLGVSLVWSLPLLALAAEEKQAEEALLPQPVTIDEQEALVVGMDDYDDPLESFNRTMFKFNDVVYRFALIPLAKTYTTLPQGARNGVSRVFLNIKEPLNLVNNTAQGKFGKAGKNIFRFVTNTIVGIGGIFDPADHWFGVAPEVQNFNDTFQAYGVANGPYLVLPFLGGTDIRGGVGSILNTTLHPVRYITDNPESTAFVVFDNFQQIAPQATNYLELRNTSDDPYIYFRNQYLQGVARDDAFPAKTEASNSNE